jgi:serine/threonine-protein kinase HSL1, negative regulator of Swe1 kinase
MTGGNDQTVYAQPLKLVSEPGEEEEEEEHSDVKRYYDEITQQLDSMSVRNSSYSDRAPSYGAPLHSPMELYPTSPAQDADSSRFADAEEDDTDMMSVHSGAPSTAVHPTSRSPMVGLGFDGSRPTLGEVSQNWGPSFSSMMSQSTHEAGPSRQTSYAESAASAPLRQAVNFRDAPPPPPQRVAPPAITVTVTPLSESSLGRDNSYVYIDMEPASPNASWNGSFNGRGGGAQSIISSWTDTSKLKRKKTASSGQPTPFSPDLSGQSSNAAKRSWFQNLFTFKPSPYTLWSYESISVTEHAIQRALLSYGVRVAVERLEGQVVLRCRWSGSKGWYLLRIALFFLRGRC